MTANFTKLSENEWNFGPLVHPSPTPHQRAELSAATVYEYARESASIRKLATEYADLPEDAKNDAEDQFSLTPLRSGLSAKRGSPALIQLDVIPFWNCILWPDFFPGTPWLKIPQSNRALRCRRFLDEHNESILRVHRIDRLEDWEFITREARCIMGVVELIPLRIVWAGNNDSDLLASFATLLKKYRPKDFPEPRGDASRANVESGLLKRLAVMRLLNKYSHATAYDLAADHDYQIPAEPSNALKMRKQVRADLRRIFQSDNFDSIGKAPLIPPSELPLHWSTLRKRRPARS